jgi:predicted HTH domain antitoxin
MLVKKMELTIAEDILMALNEKPAEFLKDMRIFAAIKFFEIGKLSLGKAADLAEMSKTDFIELLSEHRISVYNYPPEELKEDLNHIQRASKP